MYFDASLGEKALKFFRLVLNRYAFPPRDITIEVSTRCGQGCAMCFRGPLGVLPADMDIALYRRVLSNLKTAFGRGQPSYLNFVGLGEPFSNPRLADILRLTAEAFPAAELNVSTGLSALDRDAFEKLAADGIVHRVSVSLDGLDEGGDFHPCSDRIKEDFAFLRDLRAGGKDFKIRVQTLITSQPRVDDALDFAAAMGADEVQLMRVDLHAFGDAPPVSQERAIVRAASARAARLGLACRNNNSYDVFMDIASAWGRRCLITDDHIFIDVGGDVLPCFCLRDVKFGNLASMSLAEVCTARTASDFYGRQAELCRGCDIYRRHHRGKG